MSPSADITAVSTTDHVENEQLDHSEEDLQDAMYEVDDISDPKPKKKRKIIKPGDKKYNCPHADCGKAYSRAEHLYRHQLNHTPKQIYRCDFPGCERNFVRADLCARHKERHTAKGSHLQRKDAFFNSKSSPTSRRGETSPSETVVNGTTTGTATVGVSPVQGPPAPDHFPYRENHSSPHLLSNDVANSHHQPLGMREPMPIMRADSGLSLDAHVGAYGSYTNQPHGGHQAMAAPPSPESTRRFSFDSSYGRPVSQMPAYGPHSMHINSMQPPSISTPSPAVPNVAQPHYASPSLSSRDLRSPSSFQTLPSLSPFGYPQGYSAANVMRPATYTPPSAYASSDQQPMPNSGPNSVVDFNVIEHMAAGYAMPVFGNDGFNRSPPIVMDEGFLNALFDGSTMLEPVQPSPPGPEPQHNHALSQTPLPKLDVDGIPATKTSDVGINVPSTNGLDIDVRESAISENKRRRLVALINAWPDIEENPGRGTKSEIMLGSENDPTHPLNLHMLRSYLASYWVHIHQQMPILHRPTYNPETCPDLLLLAQMCLGATCLERIHSHTLTRSSAELSFFMAYHIRWEVFKDAEFRPPAKLWTFQTMLLLELFEKMYSTRTLHERAHIHHATTLTVMRRGSSLIGRSATDLPQNGDDPTRTPPGPDGSINTSGQNTPDAFWNRWITAEATRRAAFAAFIIDSTHATLFGHSAVMAPHDLRLPLPCDEALWSATSSAEVQRVEASLAANGFKPTSFLDGLKRTLNGQKVRTNTFGRVVLMSGLLNISWHMNQRDLQVSSLGAANTLGNQIKWRSPLTRAFDFWRRDFDDSLSKNELWLQVCNSNSTDRSSVDRRDSVFESRTCLHSLAHMAMHVDIVDCLVFAGAERVLGRVVVDVDRTAVQRRMREQWAPSARARDAVFYALRFLCEVLIPEEELRAKRSHPHHPPTFTYSARDDYLLNRPWVLFFALVIVWSYGFALDGPLRPSNYTLTTRELQIFDMQRYLIRIGGVASPDDLEKVKDRNSCLGLLLLLRECFKQPRWELLHDAHDVLGSCIDLLVPGHSDSAGKQPAKPAV